MFSTLKKQVRFAPVPCPRIVHLWGTGKPMYIRSGLLAFRLSMETMFGHTLSGKSLTVTDVSTTSTRGQRSIGVSIRSFTTINRGPINSNIPVGVVGLLTHTE